MTFAAVDLRMRREQNERIGMAWTMAALARAKKLPPPHKMQIPIIPPKPMTWQQHRDAFRRFAVAAGGKVITHS